MVKYIYYCDICKKQVSDKQQLNSLILPVTRCSAHQRLIRKLECCGSCFSRIRSIIQTNFVITDNEET